MICQLFLEGYIQLLSLPLSITDLTHEENSIWRMTSDVVNLWCATMMTHLHTYFLKATNDSRSGFLTWVASRAWNWWGLRSGKVPSILSLCDFTMLWPIDYNSNMEWRWSGLMLSCSLGLLDKIKIHECKSVKCIRHSKEPYISWTCIKNRQCLEIISPET